MTNDAPERIWAVEFSGGGKSWTANPKIGKYRKEMEYIRADHAQAEKESAVAAEREACAKVAEHRWREWSKRPDSHGDVVCDATACENIAFAIRSRANTARDARVRAEALREAADIKLDVEVSTDNWRQAAIDTEAAYRKAILALMEDTEDE